MSRKHWVSGLILLAMPLAVSPLAMAAHSGEYRSAPSDHLQLAQRGYDGDRYDSTVTCESKDYRRKYCVAPIKNSRVRLVRQLSDTPCVQGRTWDYDERSVWVDKGCQATFGYNKRGDDGNYVHDDDYVPLCQKMVRWKIGKEYGNRSEVSFSSGRSRNISRNEQTVEGEGVLRDGRDRQRFDYDCTIDRRQNKVSDVNYRFDDRRPAGGEDEATQRCQSAVLDKIAQEVGYRPRVNFDTPRVSQIDRDRQSVRGRANIRNKRGQDEIGYSCEVNTRRNRVSDVRYHYR